jgi:chemotaxis signal transduction protein
MLQAVNNESPADEDISSQYVTVTFEKTSILITQSEIHSIEPIEDMKQIKKSVLSTGRIDLNGHNIPVYGFSDSLEIERIISINKPICVVLKHNKDYVGILCAEAVPFKNQITRFQQLPDCMSSSASPIIMMCLSKSNDICEVNFMVSVESLLEYIDEYNNSRVKSPS